MRVYLERYTYGYILCNIYTFNRILLYRYRFVIYFWSLSYIQMKEETFQKL